MDAIADETTRVVATFQKQARLPGFRPGKAPASLIQRQFQADIRQKVLENLIPKFLGEQVEQEHLNVVSRPEVVDVHFHEGEPLRFKAEFEVAPQVELNDYDSLTVPYRDPEVTPEDIEARVDEIRDSKATFANEDPRPLADGDFAVLSLESISGLDEPVKSEEITIQINGKDTLPGFTENLRGMSPGDEKDFEVVYPEDFGQEKLAGKTVRFHSEVKGVRRKELPELNDEFAQDLGDYRTVEELREAVRKSIFLNRQMEAQQAAKNHLVGSMVDAHEFPVPEVFIENQIRTRLEQTLRSLAGQGIDPNTIKLDWEKVKSSQRDQATRDVKGSLLLSRVAEREGIVATKEEVDREVERLARQQREPVIALRAKLEKDGTLGRIASHIQTEKTLSFLFDRATKTEPVPAAPEPAATSDEPAAD